MPKIFEKLQKLRPMYDVVYKIFMLLCKIFLVADIIIMTWIVIARHIKAIPAPNWGEEVILSLMAYMAVLSAALAIRRNAHIRMTAFDRYLPPKIVHISDLIADIGVTFLAFVMLIVGLKFAIDVGAKGTYSSMPWLSQFWQYFPIPLAGIAMIFFEIERLVIDVAAICGYKITTGMENENIEDLPKEHEKEADK